MSTALASDPMGMKRVCADCGARYYDLNKRPIICPSCETEFTGEIKIKSRRGRAAIAADKKEESKVNESEINENENDDDDLEDDDGVEVVSLDDLDEKSSLDDDDEDPTKRLEEDDDLDDIPDLDEDLDDVGDDDDTLLDDDED